MLLPPARQALLNSPLGDNRPADLFLNGLRFTAAFFHHAVVAYTPAAAPFAPSS